MKGLSIDAAGNIYATGSTASFDFPLVGGLQNDRLGPDDAYVVSLTASGSQFRYSAVIGGTGLFDVGAGIAVTGSGNVVMVGSTASLDIPLRGSVQSRYGGGLSDGFIVMLNGSGTRMRSSSFLGGADSDEITAVRIGGDGSVYLTGASRSETFLKGTIRAGNDAFVTKLAGILSGCPGDCDSDETVTVAELIRGIDIALDRGGIGECSALDFDRNGRVSVSELVDAVNFALVGC